MSSELRVNRIIPVNGVPTGGGGGTIQIVQGTLISQTETSAATGTRVDIGLEVSITPIFSSSKIYLTLNSLSLRTRDPNTYITMVVQRKIGGGSFTDILTFAEYAGGSASGTNSQQEVYPSLGYLDSPNTTSQITYKIQGFRVVGSASVAYHHNSSGGHVSGIRNTATLVAMEVSG